MCKSFTIWQYCGHKSVAPFLAHPVYFRHFKRRHVHSIKTTLFHWSSILANRDNGSACPTSCICVCVCVYDVDVLCLNTQRDRMGFWRDGYHKRQLFCPGNIVMTAKKTTKQSHILDSVPGLCCSLVSHFFSRRHTCVAFAYSSLGKGDASMASTEIVTHQGQHRSETEPSICDWQTWRHP